MVGGTQAKRANHPPDKLTFRIRFLYRGLEASPSRDKKQQKQRFVLGQQSLNLPTCGQHSSGSVSPNRVAASTNTELPGPTGKEASRAIPVPPVTHNSLRVRNSVEGFSTEIEKLVWRGSGEAGKVRIPPHSASFKSITRSGSSVFRAWNRRRTATGRPSPTCSH